MPATFEFAAPAFGIQPALNSRTPRSCGPALRRRRLESFSQQVRQSRHGPLTVLPLGTLLSSNHPQTVPLQSRCQLLPQPGLAKRTQGLGTLQVESQLHSRIGGIHSLPARTRGPGEPPLQLSGWDHQTVIDRQILNHAPSPASTESDLGSLGPLRGNDEPTLFLAGGRNPPQPS